MKKFFGIFLEMLMVVAVCGYGQEEAVTHEASWEEQLNLGNRYMEEMDYEAAIAAYTAAIEIDPN